RVTTGVALPLVPRNGSTVPVAVHVHGLAGPVVPPVGDESARAGIGRVLQVPGRVVPEGVARRLAAGHAALCGQPGQLLGGVVRGRDLRAVRPGPRGDVAVQVVLVAERLPAPADR